MTTAQLIIICITVLLLAVVPAIVQLARTDAVAKPGVAVGVAVGATVVVHLDGGAAIRGVVSAVSAVEVVLGEPHILAGGEARAAGGSARVSLRSVVWVQEL